ncbi:cell wall-binding repeat-containing protein [Clostridioides mangenotii]|uniref:cell wall-binding repeat-containing protein n=1 Tax=Metaclostridioides mangenotii TaxID=1540 RepID=UPI00214A57E8|nr:cell wall-binding repeat-containing protein [Clostridioides mangenotii]MCR1954315.1 cell wall-binding repeat-containing protein [Clostridioides mangenotii]
MKLNKYIGLALTSALTLSCLTIISYADTQVKLERFDGENRYKTSLETANTVDSKEVVFTSGKNFADALSSTNIANRGAKLILVEDDMDVKPLLCGIEKVVIVGGENALSKDFEDNVRKYVPNVKRLDGKDRYETNLKTLQYCEYKDVGVADGRNYPDALASIGFLKEKNQGLMLVDGGKTYTIPSGMNVNYTFGGTVKHDIGEVIKGADRYDTAIEIAKKSSYKNMALVSGNNFADALSATNIVNSRGAYIMLVPNSIKSELKEFNGKIDNIYVVGGANSVSDKEARDTIDMINGTYTEEIELVINTPKIKPTEGKLNITIKNNSSSNIEFSSEGKLFKVLDNGKLQPINIEGIGGDSVVWVLKPKDEREMEIYLYPNKYDYKKGEYVLEKQISIGDKKTSLQGRFIIE